jgi:hypothetical protein
MEVCVHDLMARLKRLVALTNRVYEKLRGYSTHSQGDNAVFKLRGEIERLIYDRNQTIDDAIHRLLSITNELRLMIERYQTEPKEQ